MLTVADIGNHHLPAPLQSELAMRLAATTDNQLPGVVSKHLYSIFVYSDRALSSERAIS